VHRLAVDLDVGKLRDQIDLDDLRIGIAIDQLVECQFIRPSGWGERLGRRHSWHGEAHGKRKT
jgi:hypothetical protein